MQQERWHERHRHGVTPEEYPVESIERSVERERERPEEGDAQPEEMKRRLIAGTTQAHGTADEQGHQPHGRQHEVHRAAVGHEGERDGNRLTRTKSGQRVRKACPLCAVSLIRLDLVTSFDWCAVDGEDRKSVV